MIFPRLRQLEFPNAVGCRKKGRRYNRQSVAAGVGWTSGSREVAGLPEGARELYHLVEIWPVRLSTPRHASESGY
jgi:hypothetical protein